VTKKNSGEGKSEGKKNPTEKGSRGLGAPKRVGRAGTTKKAKCMA